MDELLSDGFEGFVDDYQGLTIIGKAQCFCRNRFKAKTRIGFSGQARISDRVQT
jgi:hypothetical protein